MKATIRQFVLSLMWSAVKRRYRAEEPFVIGVTGSVGKTSTKEAIATILETAGRPVVKTIGNLATDTGVPLSLLGFDEQVKGSGAWAKVVKRASSATFSKPEKRPYWVIEYSSDKPGDLAFLGKRLPLNASVFTSGGPVHLEYYKTQEAVMAELMDILNYQKPGGYVVVNGDDPFLKEAKWPEGTVTYGVTGLTRHKQKVDLRAEVGKLGGKDLECTFNSDKGTKPAFTTKVQVVGRQQLMPVVSAALVGLMEGLSVSDVKKGIEAYQIPAGRGRLIEGLKGTTIVDDSANASPEAAVAGVAMLKPWAHGRRTVAMLGTMNELGESAVEAHREVGEAAAKSVDFLVAIGQFADDMCSAAREAGMPGHRMLSFKTPEHLFTQLEQVVERNDIIYIKASQNGMRLERLVKRLMAKPDDAPSLLVRQSNAWKE